MKTIPRLLCLLVLLSASGIVSGLDRVSTRRLHLTVAPGAPDVARTGAASHFSGGPGSASAGWRCVTPAPIGPAATAGHAGQAVRYGF